MTFITDLTYPHGKLKPAVLVGSDGYLLALQYKNPASLGKALSRLRGTPYWTPPENDRAVIWLGAEAALELPHTFNERLAYLAGFEVADATRSCDKCKMDDVLYASGKFGHPLRLVCLKCSRFASATSKNAVAAREEAERLKNVLLKFRPIRKVLKPVRNLLKAA